MKPACALPPRPDRSAARRWVGLPGRTIGLAAAALALLFAAPAAAGDDALRQRVEAALVERAPGSRFGLLVETLDGRKIVAIAPDARYIPASNTKLFTTAAAFHSLADLHAPDAGGGAAVRLERSGEPVPDVILEGNGDARLSSAPDCAVNCLAMLADAVAAATREVRHVIGDDTRFPDERWSPGMSWNNIHTRSGTGISALTLDDNELHLRVVPAAAGQPPRLEGPAYFTVDNQAMTVAEGTPALVFDRLPGSRSVRLTGTIPVGGEAELLRLGIDDPAHYAAWRFRALLEARGVRVSGDVGVRHRPHDAAAGPGAHNAAAPAALPLARLVPPPLVEDIATINKASQNVHAELLLRRIGRQSGSGAIADGVAVIEAMLESADVPRISYDFSDGSGMSTYNRIAPRSVVRFLRWAASQPWGAAWFATLPIAGVDGTLSRRFVGTPLEGRLFAKTGGLNGTSALSGAMIAASGQTLLFSMFANDVPAGAGATGAIDAALAIVAVNN